MRICKKKKKKKERKKKGKNECALMKVTVISIAIAQSTANVMSERNKIHPVEQNPESHFFMPHVPLKQQQQQKQLNEPVHTLKRLTSGQSAKGTELYPDLLHAEKERIFDSSWFSIEAEWGGGGGFISASTVLRGWSEVRVSERRLKLDGAVCYLRA